MDGDFKGDFTRDTFRPQNRFSRVLMQQGRVQLDADWNEQTDLFLYGLRTFITDLVGPHWGTFDFQVDPPSTSNNNQGGIQANSISPNSFKIDTLIVDDRVQLYDFSIGKGHYYVDGMSSVLNENTSYQNQEPKPAASTNGQYLVYLDVWERQITFLEDDSIREVALGVNGPDTATRAEIVWQVKLLSINEDIPATINTNAFTKVNFVETHTHKLKGTLQPPRRGLLKARGKAPAQDNNNPCIIPPDAQFRGDENQLYRVEIHTGGTKETATFKWSRENGSVVFPIISPVVNGTNNTISVTIGNSGRDTNLSLQVNDWVEIIDDDYLLQVATLQGPGSTQPLQGSVNPLLQVTSAQMDTTNPTNILITLKNSSGAVFTVGQDLTKHPLLRRWDQKDSSSKKGNTPKLNSSGTINIVEGTTDNSWLSLEDGVQVQFQPNTEPATIYRTGDYWLIPARTIIGDVLWPQETDPSTGIPYQFGYPKALPPHGVKHHYALLALISFSGNNVTVDADLRYMVPPLGKLLAFLDKGTLDALGITGFKAAGL